MIIDPNLEEGEQMDLGLGEEYMDSGFLKVSLWILLWKPGWDR